MKALIFSKTVFKVLNVELPLIAVLIVFALIAIISLTIYFLILFRKNRKFYFEKEEVSANEFKRLEKFEDQRNDFELEIAKVRKIQRERKK
ncbi:TIGR04561 family membrane protein [Spiroplasma sp. BIUS-1]|uniref:TIGR04561 family membrane protein n=1 Tax=Spiroplasma sp. BIUS-1 TaxID=216964 RepID=UPI0013986C75|nr:TIGR04561 family membrane protein [Spiroplasma sp. BIUS-1]QHX36536.1 TIGR04561 family membrane protein [Spiroplasma sp. BIUS-1]